MITGRDERANALRAVAQGAYDFFNKPIDVEELKVVLRRALKLQALERENRELGSDRLPTSRACSAPARACRRCSRRSARSRPWTRPVLVLGESGTGKELVAHAIHRLSARAAGPFVPINCGAIPETLLESELFGHEKGSFTGAHAQRAGRIETASGGTLFLDEIGELPPPLQVKLLRFLQDHKVERVGGRATIAVDVRVVAATNADLPKLLAEGRFREDLYYRIGVVTLSMPPLRDREDDVVMLAETFLGATRPTPASKLTGFTKDAVAAHARPCLARQRARAREPRAPRRGDGRRSAHHRRRSRAREGHDLRPPGAERAARGARARHHQGGPQAQPREHLPDRDAARHQPPDALRAARASSASSANSARPLAQRGGGSAASVARASAAPAWLAESSRLFASEARASSLRPTLACAIPRW